MSIAIRLTLALLGAYLLGSVTVECLAQQFPEQSGLVDSLRQSCAHLAAALWRPLHVPVLATLVAYAAWTLYGEPAVKCVIPYERYTIVVQPLTSRRLAALVLVVLGAGVALQWPFLLSPVTRTLAEHLDQGTWSMTLTTAEGLRTVKEEDALLALQSVHVLQCRGADETRSEPFSCGLGAGEKSPLFGYAKLEPRGVGGEWRPAVYLFARADAFGLLRQVLRERGFSQGAIGRCMRLATLGNEFEFSPVRLNCQHGFGRPEGLMVVISCGLIYDSTDDARCVPVYERTPREQ